MSSMRKDRKRKGSMDKSIKAFIIPYEAWYKDTVLGEPHIYIGMYYENGGTDGEFMIVWDDIGIQLRAYDDSWKVLSYMPELIDLIGKIQIEKSKPTINEFAEMLKGIGFKDITEYERKSDDVSVCGKGKGSLDADIANQKEVI